MSNCTKHNPAINKWSQKSPDNLKDMIMMVVLSIQQPWHSVGKQMQDYRLKGSSSKYIWGNKLRTLKFLEKHKEELYRDALECLEFNYKNKSFRVMKVLLRVPGLGLPKAGFCCQLFAGCVGCIDIHNLRRLNISPNILNFNKNSTDKTKERRIKSYIDACSKRKCSWLWNTWCSLIAKKQPERWQNSSHVSLVHLEYLQ